MARKSEILRRTKETEIKIALNLDGSGKHSIKTPVPAMNRLLGLMAEHGLFDLKIIAKGDIEIDDHHTVEDLGIALGKAIKLALKQSVGILRYGEATVPVNDALVHVAIDILERPYLVYQVPSIGMIKGFDAGLIEDFFISLGNHAGITLHIRSLYGKNQQDIVDAVFIALGRALKAAVTKDKRIKGMLTTK